MNHRLIQNGLLVTVVPVLAAVLVGLWDGAVYFRFGIAGLGLILQVLILRQSRQNLRKLTNPSDAVLARMDCPGMAMAYEPERYKWDLRVVTGLSGLSTVTPLAVVMAEQLPTQALKAGAWFTASQKAALWGLGVIVVSTISHLVWARMEQAAVIVHTGSDKRRYALRGFAEALDQPGGYARYLRALEPEKRRLHLRYEMD